MSNIEFTNEEISCLWNALIYAHHNGFDDLLMESLYSKLDDWEQSLTQ